MSNGGRHLMANGYIRVWSPGHPTAAKDGYALEHRLVLHEAGVLLPSGHHVHHLNGNKTDNRAENLAVLSVGEHGAAHRRERQLRACERCGQPFLPWKEKGRYCSRQCANQRDQACA